MIDRLPVFQKSQHSNFSIVEYNSLPIHGLFSRGAPRYVKCPLDLWSCCQAAQLELLRAHPFVDRKVKEAFGWAGGQGLMAPLVFFLGGIQ